MLFVEKFGGSSLAGVERVRCAARLIADTVRAGHSVAAVLSAQGKTTDALLSTAAHYSRSPSKRELDMLLATGEQASVALMAMTLAEMGLPAVSLTGWQAGVGTDETYGDAHIRRLSMERVRRELDEGKVVLIAGFQGVSPGNDITTLGRGGSDTSAVALAAALSADELTIYTDVDGIFSSDPRICPDAVRRERISYDDMLLLAQKGAQVLHDRSVALAQASGVPITVKSCETGSRGSIVCERGDVSQVVGVTQKTSDTSQLAAITAVGDALPSVENERAVVSALEHGGVNVYAIAGGERFLSVYVLRADADRALRLAHSALIR